MADPLSSILAFPFRLAARGVKFEESSRANALANKEALRAADFSEAAAVDALRRGAQLAGQARLRGALLADKQGLAFTASGVDATLGTAASVRAETAMHAELDAQTATNNAYREALGHREVTRKYRAAAEEAVRRQVNDTTETFLGLAGDTFGLAGSFMGGES